MISARTRFLFGVFIVNGILMQGLGCNLESNAPKPVIPQEYSASLTLMWETVSDETISVGLDYHRVEQATAPRIMELFVHHSPTLQFVSLSKGDAIIAAGKELVVQKKSDQMLRIVMYAAANVYTLDSGRLATLRFHFKEKTPVVVEILAERPVFAPSAANEGLILSDPLYLWADQS